MGSRTDLIANITSRNSAVYGDLLGPRAIRLLELRPGTGEDPLFCKLIVVEELNTNTRYEALSYCWGDASLIENITCNSSPYLVTRNLRDALRKLRLQDQARILWVDAICINQHDSHERNRQVAFMRQIYAHAARVYVWLGDSSEEHPLAAAADSIRRIATEILKAAYGPATRSEWLQRLSEVNDLSEVVDVPAYKGKAALLWPTLAPFYTNEWFGRIWVIQEVQACGDAWLMFDSDMIEWPLVDLVVRWIRSDREAMRVKRETPTRHISSWLNCSYLRADFMAFRHFFTPLRAPFLWVLHWIRRFEASDPRDRVYAMLQHPVVGPGERLQGFEPHTHTPHLGIRPDYRRSTAEVLLEVAIEAIKQSRRLEILNYCWQGQPTTLTGHDWVPRWDLDSMRIVNPLPTWLYCASGPTECALPDSRGRLDLQGLLLGIVNGTGYLLAVKDSSNNEHRREAHQSIIRVESTEQLVRMATQDRWADSRHPTTASSPPGSAHRMTVKMAHFAAWLCRHIQRSSDNPLDDFYVSGTDNVCDSCRCDNFSARVALPQPPEIYGCDECAMGDFDLCHTCVLIKRKHCYNPDHTLHLRARTGLWIQRKTLSDMAALLNQIETQMTTIGWEHRFAADFRRYCMWFSTSTNLVGSARLLTRPGDLVVVLFGANVPFILRRRSDTGRYRVISDCYVDGMMDGQALEMWKRGELEVMDVPMS